MFRSKDGHFSSQSGAFLKRPCMSSTQQLEPVVPSYKGDQHVLNWLDDSQVALQFRGKFAVVRIITANSDVKTISD